MKTMKCFFIGMLILAASYASAFSAKETNLLGNYFLQKSLITNEVKAALFRTVDGDLKPILIYSKSKTDKELDSTKTMVHVENLEVNMDENSNAKVTLVYHIDNNIEVTHTFILDNDKNWKSMDATIHYFKGKKI
jgi:hypothetical protein